MQVQLLGPVQLYGSDELIELGRPQQRCVFALLALSPGQTVPVESLVERVWGEAPPRNGRTALYSYVSRLRGVLREADPSGQAALRRRSGGYALEIDPDLVDLHRSRRLAVEARAASAAGELATAASLFTEATARWHACQSPLGGLSGDWADRTRTGLAHEGQALLVERFDAAIRAGWHETVIGPLSEAVAAHPLTESLARLLMLALYRAGSHADALETFAALRRRMVDELGDEPGPAVRRMHEQILRRDPDLDLEPEQPPAPPAAASDGEEERATAAAWVPLCQLPPVPPHLVGRAELLAQLVATLQQPAHDGTVALATITGPPGVGKTALAAAVAHRLRETYPDGQWYVHLGSAAPGRVLAELLEASGMDSGLIPDGLDRRAAALRSRLADRRVLLLLDDAEGAAQLRPLLPGTPQAAVLVTSRNRLAGLAEASDTVQLPPLADRDAVELVSRVAGADRVDREPDAVAELCRWCGGLPLAVRIAASRLAAHPDLPVQRFAQRLRDHRHRLNELAVDDLAVRPGLHLSYQGLDGVQQALLRHLAALGNHPVAEWTLGVLVDDATDGSRHAEALAAASLLDSLGADATGEPRYRLHDLVAAYAGELAEAQPQQVRAAARRQLDALMALSDSAYRHLHVDTTDLPAAQRPIPDGVLPAAEVARQTADPVGWLVAERASLVATISRACDLGWHADAAALADRVLTHVLRVHVGPSGIRRIYEQIRDTARTAGDELVAWRAEARLCTELAISGRIAAAADGLSGCADAFERIGADAELAFSLGASANYQRYLGGGPELLARAQRALSIARGCGAKTEVEATRQLAAMLAGLGRRGDALPLFERALDLATTHGLIADRTVTLLNMAAAAYAHGELDQAEATSSRAMELVDGTTDPRGVAYLLLLSARIAAARDRRQDALEGAEEAAGWFSELGDVLGEAMAHSQVGRLRLAFGDAAQAVPLLESAAHTLHSVGMYAAHTDTLSTLTEARAVALAAT